MNVNINLTGNNVMTRIRVCETHPRKITKDFSLGPRKGTLVKLGSRNRRIIIRLLNDELRRRMKRLLGIGKSFTCLFKRSFTNARMRKRPFPAPIISFRLRNTRNLRHEFKINTLFLAMTQRYLTLRPPNKVLPPRNTLTRIISV